MPIVHAAQSDVIHCFPCSLAHRMACAEQCLVVWCYDVVASCYVIHCRYVAANAWLRLRLGSASRQVAAKQQYLVGERQQH
jgi:hypothetical protein